jgi:hypothetical protein
MLMARLSRNKRRVGERRFDTPSEGIVVYNTPKEFKKEQSESKQREQEAARESD